MWCLSVINLFFIYAIRLSGPCPCRYWRLTLVQDPRFEFSGLCFTKIVVVFGFILLCFENLVKQDEILSSGRRDRSLRCGYLFCSCFNPPVDPHTLRHSVKCCDAIPSWISCIICMGVELGLSWQGNNTDCWVFWKYWGCVNFWGRTVEIDVMTIFIINSLHQIIVGDQIKDDEVGSGACIIHEEASMHFSLETTDAKMR
jgi:hypothetical protein